MWTIAQLRFNDNLAVTQYDWAFYVNESSAAVQR